MKYHNKINISDIDVRLIKNKDTANQEIVNDFSVYLDIELDEELVLERISRELVSAIQKQRKDMGFDIAVMASSIQCLRKPRDAMKNILKVANECVITLPNFGNWELRLGILNGKMPSSAQLPAKWYETKNLHLCTIADFEELCRDESFVIKKKVYLNRQGSSSWLANTFPNLFAAQAVYLIG